MKIIIDCFGGDKSPSANIEGALAALREHDDLSLIFTGDEELIMAELKKHEYDALRYRRQDQGCPESSRDEPDGTGPASKQDAPHNPEI